MNTFYNQMFNPQYVNLQYYRQIEQLQYEAKQNEEIVKSSIRGRFCDWLPNNYVYDLRRADFFIAVKI